MKPLTKITFFIDNFAVLSPGQQLLDRFLIGYNHDGVFHTPGCRVELASTGAENSAVDARTRQFRLQTLTSINDAAAHAENAVIAAPAQIVRDVLTRLPRGARCFVYGTIARDENLARELVSIASQRNLALRAGTSAATAFQLPPIEIPARARKAAVVTFGPVLEAELDALDALWSLAPATAAATSVKSLAGEPVWKAAYSSDWADLFAAAFSRSNTILGDPVTDGRTQDVVGLRLVEKLVQKPRAWVLESGETQIAIFVMNGALEDLNLAVQSNSGQIVSTQLYRSPARMQDEFSALAANIEDFFRRDTPPSGSPALVLIPAVLEKMRALSPQNA